MTKKGYTGERIKILKDGLLKFEKNNVCDTVEVHKAPDEKKKLCRATSV